MFRRDWFLNGRKWNNLFIIIIFIWNEEAISAICCCCHGWCLKSNPAFLKSWQFDVFGVENWNLSLSLSLSLIIFLSFFHSLSLFQSLCFIYYFFLSLALSLVVNSDESAAAVKNKIKPRFKILIGYRFDTFFLR